MHVYLVGGAVRDQLLGYAVHERDWVVVGGSVQALIAQGYQQVGKDFPVFLHPDTREEYALARMERKLSPGYYGFACDFGAHVTLEEDLARRDLTINAMAMDDKGRLIDPYHGQDDLRQKIIRHVSDAFVEDPVRVLRVARFVARFHHLGFRLANETRQLMYRMMKRGELGYLIAERVWQEWQKSLCSKNPEQFILTLRACGALQVILPELDALFGVPNPCLYHPEIDSGVHTLMVLQAAVDTTDDPMIRFAALLHDLGKALSPMSHWPSHHGHEERGVLVIEHLCQRLRIPVEYRCMAQIASRFHLSIHRIYDLRADTIVTLLERVDAFRRPKQFQSLLMVCQADAEGRKGVTKYPQRNSWIHVLEECAKIDAKQIIAEGFKGADIKEQLHKRRVTLVQSISHSWKTHEK